LRHLRAGDVSPSGIVSQTVKGVEQWSDAHRSPKDNRRRISGKGFLPKDAYEHWVRSI
jgi:hypothetical protein